MKMGQQVELSRRGFMAAGTIVSVTTAAAVSAVRSAGAAPTSSASVGGKVVKASSFGHNLTDCTAFLQAALDSDAGTVVVDDVPGGWLTGPLFINRDDFTVLVEPDVMVRAVPGAFPSTSDCLLTIDDHANVTISGYGATFAMAKQEYTSGESRMVIEMYSARNVTIEGLTLRDSGGDGIYIGRGGINTGKASYSSNITIKDVSSVNNRRQGISVISVDGLAVSGCAFRDTQGTPPASGVDFEPNLPDERLANIQFADCVFERNSGSGLQFALHKLDATSTPISILMQRCAIRRQVGWPTGQKSVGGVLYSPGLDTGATGTVELEDVLVESGPTSCAVGVLGKDAGAQQLTLTNVTVWDWGNATQVYPTVAVVPGSTTEIYGGVTFTDNVVVTDQPAPFFGPHYHNNTGPMTDVRGNFTVVDPNGVQADFGTPPPQNVDVKVRSESVSATARVRAQARQRRVQGGERVEVVFTRTGGDYSTPLAVAYETSGTARERYDYGGLAKVAVIRPGQREVTVPVQTYARRRDIDPQQRSLTIELAPGFRYTTDQTPPAHVVIDS